MDGTGEFSVVLLRKVAAYHKSEDDIILLLALVFLHLSFWPVACRNKEGQYTTIF